MSTELAQDDDEAGDYDLDTMERQIPTHDEDEMTPIPRHSIAEDGVVFEIGDAEGHDDSEDDQPIRKGEVENGHLKGHESDDDERKGLMGRRSPNVKDRTD
jgi:hypothetical protein